MPTLYSALRPLLFRASPEGAHHLSIRAGKLGQRAPGVLRAVFRSGLSREQAARLSVRALGLEFANPIGVAAGLDKNAELIPMWAAVGLGFCEVGSISALPSAGNPKPRAFRLPEDRALVNRMGLNNHGLDAIARRIERTRRPAGFPLAINIVKTHDPSILGDAGIQDFAASTRRLLPLADLLVLNVSCPNTTEGKTFEDPEALEPLLDAVMGVRTELASTVPVLVKLSPPATVDFDSTAVDELVDLSLERGIAGFVATNTASDRAGLRTSPGRLDAIGRGGLSGAPLASRAEALVRHLARRAGDRATIIGVGGIDSPEEAYRRIRAGASLVELYTGLVYEGPGLIPRTARRLIELLDADGLERLEDAVGLDQ
ncbi:quinone-dependent dihydroorotate dehydrogenase [Planctomycetota bacterium]|nr:quinone-dependent dihydroorotate dehydrogenase [Planctomycetota bacterium]